MSEARPLLYVAGPVDYAGGDPFGPGDVVKPAWSAGFNVYSPLQAFYVHGDSKPNGAVQRVNEAALLAADAVLAVWPAGVASVGTPVEVDRALRRGLPVALVHDGWLGRSWQVADWQEQWQSKFFQADSVQTALLWLSELLDTLPPLPKAREVGEDGSCVHCGAPQGAYHLDSCAVWTAE